MDVEVKKVVAALMADLLCKPKDGGNHGCTFACPPKDGDTDVVVNGHIDLASLAVAAIEALSR